METGHVLGGGGGSAILIFLIVWLGNLVLHKLVDWASAPSKEEAELDSKITALQREARRLDAVSTFVRWSKVQRQLQTLEKQRHRLRSERSQKRTTLPDNPIFTFLFKQLLSTIILPLAVIIGFWNQPILVAEASTFSPWFVSSWLAIPGWPAGTVGVVAWVAICRSVAHLLPI